MANQTRSITSGNALLNDGAKALRASGLTPTQVGERYGVSRQAASKWFCSTAIPTEEIQLRMEADRLVAREQWVRGGPAKPAKVNPVGALPSVVQVRPQDQAELADVPQMPSAGWSTPEALRAQSSRLTALLTDASLSTAARIQTERALSTTLSALTKAEGTQISESTVVKHPAHRRVMAAILSALEPFPEALRAVADALHAREG